MHVRFWSTAEARFFKMEYEEAIGKLVEYAEKAVAERVLGRRIAREAITYWKLLAGDPEILKAASRHFES